MLVVRGSDGRTWGKYSLVGLRNARVGLRNTMPSFRSVRASLRSAPVMSGPCVSEPEKRVPELE
jgi:hypothetical protein